MNGRGSSRRRYIKLYVDGRLSGSVVYQLTEAQQSVWDKLLCLAGRVNRDGQISDNDGRAFPISHVAYELHTDLELFEETLKKCEEEGRVTQDEAGIHISNWQEYQSEYSRQKKYRDKAEGEEEPAEPIEEISEEELGRDPAAETLWDKAKGKLKGEMTASNYRQWVADARAVSIKGDTLILGLPRVQAAEYLRDNLKSLLEKTLGNLTRPGARVEFRVIKGG